MRKLIVVLVMLAASARAAEFEVQKVADGVYAAVRTKPPGLMFDANSVFIINDDDVVVVDTNITPASARETLAALRKLTAKPVRYVVNTHWHDDHMIGNAVYREAFPNVELIGHSSFAADASTIGAANRKGTLTGGPQLVADMKKMIAAKKSFDGSALTDEERISFQSDVDAAERYFAAAPEFHPIMPTITIEDELTLVRGKRSIEIRHLGRGHSGADLVVWLPNERIAITGDLVVWPVPLVGSTSFPREYASALQKLLALKPAAFIPGHGPVLRDDAYVQLMARLLGSIADQTEAAAKRGATLEEARKSVKLDELRTAFAGDSKLKQLIFDFYVAGPGVAAAYKQATAPAAPAERAK
jgi:glyoxylase-like metal-dependent hydrolase (beta-lactamase superfamily II)